MKGKKQEKKDHGFVIGFDCHPETFTAAAVSGKNPLEVKTEWLDHLIPISQLESWLEKRVSDCDLIVIEASGNTFSIVDRIQKLGKSAVILESFTANRVKKTYCSTDKTSAVSLARVYLSGLASFVWHPDRKTCDRREILHNHERAVSDVTRSKNRITGYLNRHCLLRLKKSDYLDKDVLSEILEVKDWTPTQKIMITQMFADLQHATEKRKVYRSIMAQELLNDDKWIQVIRIFGVRHIVAFALMAIIGDINRFQSPKKLVAYMGLNPRVIQSGKSDKSVGMSRHGRRDIRSLLVQSAHTVFKSPDNPLYSWAWKLQYRKGKNVAVIAVARKIVVSIWYLLKGQFTTLEELPDDVRRKIGNLIKEVGGNLIKDLGYSSLKDYREEKYRFLLNSS